MADSPENIGILSAFFEDMRTCAWAARLTVVSDGIVHQVAMLQALDCGDVDDPARLAYTATDSSYDGRRKIEKNPEPGNPLLHELTAMNEDERVHAACGDHRPCDDRLSEPGRRRQHAGLVREQRIGGKALLPGQFTEKCRIDATSGIALIKQRPGSSDSCRVSSRQPRGSAMWRERSSAQVTTRGMR